MEINNKIIKSFEMIKKFFLKKNEYGINMALAEIEDINSQDGEGNTLMHLAADDIELHGLYEIFKKNGGSHMVLNNRKKRPTNIWTKRRRQLRKARARVMAMAWGTLADLREYLAVCKFEEVKNIEFLQHLVVDASRVSNYDILKWLIDKGASLNYHDSVYDCGGDLRDDGYVGNTALHYAIFRDDKKMVQFLLQKGADVNAKGGGGQTPMHAAAYYEWCHFIYRTMKKMGGDVHLLDDDKKTPEELYVTAKRRLNSTFLIRTSNGDMRDYTQVEGVKFRERVKKYVYLFLEKKCFELDVFGKYKEVGAFVEYLKKALKGDIKVLEEDLPRFCSESYRCNLLNVNVVKEEAYYTIGKIAKRLLQEFKCDYVGCKNIRANIEIKYKGKGFAGYKWQNRMQKNVILWNC